MADDDFIVLQGLAPEKVARFKACSAGCDLLVQHVGTVEARNIGQAQVRIQLLVGPPNIRASDDFLKFLSVRTTDPLPVVRHVADVLMFGDYDQGNVFSFPLPTHEPIMVLRDPPGGSSYAVYENLQSTMRVTIRGEERYAGFDTSADVSSGAGTEVETCTGLGVMLCLEVVDASWTAGAEVGGGKDFETVFHEDSNTAEFTTTWTYTTSKDVWNPGHHSDVFVVPSLNVQFNQIQPSNFDPDACVGVKPPAVRKFNVDAPAERAVSFLTHQTPTRFELPKLEQIIADKEARLAEMQTNDTERERVQSEKDRTERALAAWNNVLAEHENTNQKAADASTAVAPFEWFDKVVNKTGFSAGFEDHAGDDDKLTPTEHWSGLVPHVLSDARKPLDADDTQDLEDISIIKFDGGGTELGFWLKQDKVIERSEKFGGVKENARGRFHTDVHRATSVGCRTRTLATSSKCGSRWTSATGPSSSRR